MTNLKIKLEELFYVSDNKNEVICPPESVFKTNFSNILFTTNDIFSSENIYNEFKHYLQKKSNAQILITENLGATKTDRNNAFSFQADLLKANYKEILTQFDTFDYPFGLTANHFFINSISNKWAIYISEFPNIVIIGCDDTELSQMKSIFKITDSGFSENEILLKHELSLCKDENAFEIFIHNYNIS